MIVGLLVFMGKVNWGRERDPGPQPIEEEAMEAETVDEEEPPEETKLD